MTHITGLAEQVDKYLRKNGIKRLRGAKIGPSEISSSCPRQIVLGRNAEAVIYSPDEKLEDISARLEGTALHRYFQEAVLPAIQGIEVIATEKWIESEYINGSIDAIIKDSQTGECRVLEIKTVKQAKFNEMREKRAPRTEYIEQMLLYMDHENIKTGEIFVINRGLFEDKKLRRAHSEIMPQLDDEMFLSFIVSMEDKSNFDLLNDVKVRVKNYYQLLIDFKENGIIPEVPEDANPNAFPCLWCRFKHYCWQNAYKTLNIHDLPKEELEEIEKLFKKYMSAKRSYQEAVDNYDKVSSEVKKFFRKNTRLEAWAISGNNYTIATDGEIFLLKGISNIEDRIDRDEIEYPNKRSTVSFKTKKHAPEPGKLIGVAQTNLFDTSVLEKSIKSDSSEEYLKMILNNYPE